MTLRLRTLLLALAALLLAGAAAAVLVVWRGVYDISATRQHTRPVYQLLDVAMRQSVKARAQAVPPADLDTRQRIAAGAAHFRSHCVQCHGAPGVPPDPLAFGLTPAPANLLPAGRHWKPPELFWVVREGIKMTGMPAWVYRLSDEEIWDVVAFLRAMPAMAVRDYEELVATLPRSGPVVAPGSAARADPAPLRPGDAEAGRRATARYLCATCHEIPGFVAANNQVGPPLGGMASRGFIGGVLPNTPENMVRWLKDPRGVDPMSAMPALGLTEQDARDIAAFMATLDTVAAK